MKYAELKNEAIKRMKILQLKDEIIKEFKDTDTLYISNLGGTLEIADDEQMKFVKEIEQTKNMLVYHLIHIITRYQDITYYLFVDNNKKEWIAEKKDLERTYTSYTLALCYTKVKSFNEIGFWHSNGRITHIT